MMKIILMLVLTLLAAFVVADHQGLLGLKTTSELDYFDVRFKAKESQSGETINDFFVNCTRRGSRNACSLEQGSNKRSRLVKFAIVRRIEKSWLFKRNESIVGADELNLQLMFIHPHYQRLSQTYSLKQLMAMQDQTITVKLKRETE